MIADNYEAAGKIYVLDLEVVLPEDVTLAAERLVKYRLWNSRATGHAAYLLPDSTRMYTDGEGRLQYVADVVGADVSGSGSIYPMDVITALTAEAFANPVLPFGTEGSLDFRTGGLTVPAGSDFELCLDEVSGGWLLRQFREGTFRMLAADREEINSCVLDGAALPYGRIAEGITEGGEAESLKRYWVGDTPETASDPYQELIFLIIDETTDEVEAFRTSPAALGAGVQPVEMSLCVFRDTEADRAGVEKYNVMFFDTPERVESLFKVVTGIMTGGETETPGSLEIVLLGYNVEGTDLPAYAVRDQFYVLLDGTDGRVDLPVYTVSGRFYETCDETPVVESEPYSATFDGDVFESGFVRIEGIRSGDLRVTVKKDHYIWAEWTGEDTAEDIAGRQYDGVADLVAELQAERQEEENKTNWTDDWKDAYHVIPPDETPDTQPTDPEMDDKFEMELMDM